jgi:hypothetical protein
VEDVAIMVFGLEERLKIAKFEKHGFLICFDIKNYFQGL